MSDENDICNFGSNRWPSWFRHRRPPAEVGGYANQAAECCVVESDGDDAGRQSLEVRLFDFPRRRSIME